MALEQRQQTVSAEFAGRVDLVVRELTGKPRSHLRGMCTHGCVTINGRQITEPSAPVVAGDIVEVRFDPQRRYREEWRSKFQSRAFRVVYEDDSLIVVDKQAGLLTVPTEAQERNTLVDQVSRYLGGRERALVVHRLDRETSGLLVLAKDSATAGALQDQLRLRAPQREYFALIAGRMKLESGTFESYLATSKRLSQHSVENSDHGEHAVTHFQVEQVLADTTLVRVQLDTGRRNQIRVHFAEADHPILGDRRYRPNLAAHPDWTHHRLALHATILGFQHPVTGKSLRFESQMPRSFQIFMRQQRRATREALCSGEPEGVSPRTGNDPNPASGGDSSRGRE